MRRSSWALRPSPVPRVLPASREERDLQNGKGQMCLSMKSTDTNLPPLALKGNTRKKCSAFTGNIREASVQSH
jgi:hypothetical protein